MTEGSARRRAVVIGAGWSGLTAGLRLAEQGWAVTVVDAAPQPGGRARSHRLTWRHGVHGPVEFSLDNGQHLLIGAYVDTLGLLDRLGALNAATVDRRPMRIHQPGGLRLTRPSFRRDGPHDARSGLVGTLLEPLTPLWGLMTAQGLSTGERWALVRTLGLARLKGWQPAPGVRTVADWYAATRQPARMVSVLWQPLVVSTMNTPAQEACAATFLRVLRDSLGSEPAASDFVMPRVPLGDFFVNPMVTALETAGGHLQLRRDVRRIDVGEAHRYRISVSARPGIEAESIDADAVVIATPPGMAARLLRPIAAADLVADLERFTYLPITTAYVGWPAHKLPDTDSLAPIQALRTDPDRGHHAHWLFDRGIQGPWRVGALVVSDSRALLSTGDRGNDDALTNGLIHQLASETGLPAPDQLTLIHEKRATFACTPDRPRLHARSASDTLPGLVLAGDYAWPDYPATLEGAVRSGLAAATALGRAE